MTNLAAVAFQPIRVRAQPQGWVVEDHRRWRSRIYTSRRRAMHTAQTFARLDRRDVVVHFQNGDIEQILASESVPFQRSRRKSKPSSPDDPGRRRRRDRASPELAEPHRSPVS